MNRVEGKAALITGGGAGIGAATGELICAEGGMALLVDANAQALAGTMKAIAQRVPGARVSTFAADVADAGEAARAVEHALQTFGRLDILINNAAMRNYSAIADSTPAEWQAMAAVNIVGTANYCKAALPALRRGGHASIVNVSSCYALTGRKGMGLYDATKAAILAVTRTLAFEEVVHGVRVNAVCPGSTLTDFHISRAKAPARPWRRSRPSAKLPRSLAAGRRRRRSLGRFSGLPATKPRSSPGRPSPSMVGFRLCERPCFKLFRHSPPPLYALRSASL
jgi:2-hydroxycyclohexanecarboxyl-CoA dehydrogenase